MSLLDIVKHRKSEDIIVDSVKPGSTYFLSISTNEKNIEDCAFEVTQNDEVKTFDDDESFKTLDDLCEQIKKYEQGGKSGIDQRKERKKRKIKLKKRRLFVITDSCLCKCLERCINEKSFYSVKSLNYLIKNDLISLVVHKLLVECYMKYDDLELLRMIVSNLDINEEIVIQILQFVLKNIDEETCQRILHNEQMQSCSVSKDILQRFVELFSIEIKHFSLKQHLKLLESKEAMVLLKILQYLVKQTSLAMYSDVNFKINKDGLSEMKILGWIDALVSAHTITFATNNSMKSTIRSLGAITNYQVRFYQSINELVPFVDVFKNAYELPSRKLENYSIETITL